MPTFNGIKTHRAKHLGFRDGDPQRDLNLDGRPVNPNYVSIVRLKDCALYSRLDDERCTRHGKYFYDPAIAPAIPIAHGATNYGYGKWRHTSARSRYLFDHDSHSLLFVSHYWTCPFYYVKNGYVYQGTCYRTSKPEGWQG